MTLRYTGERAIPWNAATGAVVMVPHIMRYAWATQFAWQKRVVDLGCGSGYGSYILSMVAREVVGLDWSINAIFYAKDTFEAQNLKYKVLNLAHGDIPRARGGLYVAFEVLEHLEYPDDLLQSLDAPLVWSIPISNVNQWHKQVLTLDEIESLMGNVTHLQAPDTRRRCVTWVMMSGRSTTI